jgi:hypothetical protein
MTEEAEATLCEILADEPSLGDTVWIEAVELPEPRVN